MSYQNNLIYVFEHNECSLKAKLHRDKSREKHETKSGNYPTGSNAARDKKHDTSPTELR
jgi:hypothetical protein